MLLSKKLIKNATLQQCVCIVKATITMLLDQLGRGTGSRVMGRHLKKYMVNGVYLYRM